MTTWTVVAVLVGTAVAMPLVRRELLRRELLDHPNLRSSHALPTPRGGGLGVLAGLATGALVSALAGASVPGTASAAAVGAGALTLAMIGWIDDVRGLPALPRLAGQVLTGAAVGGLVCSPGTSPLWYAALGALVVPISVNTVNFMDGINGITGATMLVWGVSLWLSGIRHGQPDVSLLAAATAAAAVGFLPFNAPVARIFLGDVGSYAFGALVGGTTLLALGRGMPWPTLVAPLVPSLVDVTLTLARRARRGASLLSAHREHVYQLVSARAGHPLVAAGMGALAAGCAATVAGNSDSALALLMCAAVVSGVFAVVAARWGPTARDRRR